MSELLKEFIKLADTEGIPYIILSDEKIEILIKDENFYRHLFVEYNGNDCSGNLRFYEKPRLGSPKGIINFIKDQERV